MIPRPADDPGAFAKHRNHPGAVMNKTESQLQTGPLNSALTNETERQMETGPLKGPNKRDLSGVEVLDFVSGRPMPKSHFSFVGCDKAGYEKSESAWIIHQSGYMRFRIDIPRQHGVVLIPELRRVSFTGEDDFAIIKVKANNHEWLESIDPRNLNYQKQSWYIPHYMFKEGDNLLTIGVIEGTQTDVMLRSAAIMRFDLETQKKDFWCWAAVTASIAKFINAESELTQCQVANKCFGGNEPQSPAANCCESGGKKTCDQPFSLTDALEVMGMHVSRCNYPLSLTELRNQIEAGMPVAVRIEWRGGGGHFVVITAIGPDHCDGDSFTWLRIADPMDKVASYIPYGKLKNTYKGNGKWTYTYLVKR